MRCSTRLLTGVLLAMLAAPPAFAAIHVVGSVQCNGSPHCTSVRVVCPDGHEYNGQSPGGSFDVSFQNCGEGNLTVYVGGQSRSYPCCGGTIYTGVWFTCAGGCSGPGCFLAGTRITMADGSTKPIEKIGVGDVVLAYDESTNQMQPDKVSRVYDPVREPAYLIINDRIRVTPTHPVRVQGSWVETGELKVGDTLTDAQGDDVRITKMELVAEEVTVYNFAVNPFRTFVAEGIIAHNKTPPSTPVEPDP
jgi:hypothetical protein